jgi:hypothetical protein
VTTAYDWAEAVWFWADDPPLVYTFSRKRRRRDFHGVRMRLKDRRRLSHGQPPPVRPRELPPRSRWRWTVHAWRVARRHFMAPRSMWGEGPWTGEPDELYWRHAPSNYPCAIWRNAQGALCGYVGVPPAHPLHGAGYDAAGEYLEAHGGLTFADTFEGRHLAAPEEWRLPVWWFLGFDCGHAFDLSPAMNALRNSDPVVSAWRARSLTMAEEFSSRWRETYKSVAMVRAMVEDLAAQAYENRVLPVDVKQTLARIVTGEATMTAENEGTQDVRPTDQ